METREESQARMEAELHELAAHVVELITTTGTGADKLAMEERGALEEAAAKLS